MPQRDATLADSHRTNNVSESWHNRLRVIVGKHHPDLYAEILELQKKQGNTETCSAKLSPGKRAKNSPAKKWAVFRSITLDFDDCMELN
jgi:hypothetical protein